MFGFSAGLSGLTAARVGLQTAGHNIANASTPGYARQRVSLGTIGGVTSEGYRVGGGVSVRSIDRITDELLVSRVRDQRQEVGRRSETFDVFRDVEAAFGEPGSSGVASRLGDFFNSLSALGTTPEASQRDGVVQSAVTFTERLRQVRTELTNIVSSVRNGARDVADAINTLGESLAEVNRQISRATGTNDAPSELLDRQTQIIEELAEYIDVQVHRVSDGQVNVNVSGRALVTGQLFRALEVEPAADGHLQVVIEGSGRAIEIQGGRLKALLDLDREGVDAAISRLDRLAGALAVEFNRIHSTGVPLAGGLTSSTSSIALKDIDGDGLFGDVALSEVDLPLELSQGDLTVSVRNRNTGAVTQTRIPIDPQNDTVQEVVDRLNSVSGLSVAIDPSGRIVFTAQPGRDFHFAPIVDPNPDDAETFGSGAAQIIGIAAEPFALSVPSTFTLSVDGGVAQTISLAASDFADPSQATTDEVVAAINSQVTGAQARNVDGLLVLASNIRAGSSSLLVTEGAGAPASILGLSQTLETGSDLPVSVRAAGTYTGTTNNEYVIRPSGNGTIGVTPGLSLEVRSAAGALVAVIDVGDTYEPNSAIDIGNGVTLAFSPGEVSSDANDQFRLLLTAESDPAGFLAGFGINSFFTGSSAADLSVSSAVRDNPELLAAGLSESVGDTRNIVRLLALREAGTTRTDDLSLADFYGSIVADVGRDTSRAELAFETQTQLLDALGARLEEVRGVNIDEELADLQKYQQAFQAAARYLSTVNEVTQVLLSI